MARWVMRSLRIYLPVARSKSCALAQKPSFLRYGSSLTAYTGYRENKPKDSSCLWLEEFIHPKTLSS